MGEEEEDAAQDVFTKVFDSWTGIVPVESGELSTIKTIPRSTRFLWNGAKPQLNSQHTHHPSRDHVPSGGSTSQSRCDKVMILTQHSLMCSVSSFAHEPEFCRALAQCSDFWSR